MSQQTILPYPTDLSLPRLVVLEQGSLAQEKFAKNGEQKDVHVVVKNSPFLLKLGFSASHLGDIPLDFNNIAVDAQLVYDSADQRRVDFIRKQPIEYKAHINENATQMTIEMRLKVLSSQLEDMHFRLRFIGLRAVNREPLAPLICQTEPIKTVSKPDQVAKIMQQQSGTPAPTVLRKKRSHQDMMMDKLNEIEQQQRHNRSLLEKLCARGVAGTECDTESEVDLLSLLFQSPEPQPQPQPQPQQQQQHQQQGKFHYEQISCSSSCSSTSSAPKDFEQAFQNLVDAYNSLSAEERPGKIRRIVRSTTGQDGESVSQMVEQLQYELAKDQFTQPQSMQSAQLLQSMQSMHPPQVPQATQIPHVAQASQQIQPIHSAAFAEKVDPDDSAKIMETFYKEFLGLQ